MLLEVGGYYLYFCPVSLPYIFSLIYVLAILSHCCALVFSSCRSRSESYFSLRSSGFPLQWLLLLCKAGCMGFVPPQHGESFWTRDQICAPCIGRQILNYWATRVVLLISLIIFDDTVYPGDLIVFISVASSATGAITSFRM